MIHATLKEFLTTGKLNAIVVGLTQNDVRRLLGEPNDSSPAKQKPVLWKYGCLQIAFYDDKLHFVGLYFDDNAPLPENLVIEGYWPTTQTTFDEYSAYLRGAGVANRVDPAHTYTGQRCLITESGVHTLFQPETTIHSIQFLANQTERGVQKQ